MRNSQLNRVINLVKRTGDRVVVLDQETEEVLVMLTLDSYEDLFGESVGGDDWTPFDFAQGDPECKSSGSPNDDSDLISSDWSSGDWGGRAGGDETASDEKLPDSKPLESTPVIENTASVEVDLADVPHEEEEEKFYLEPVE